MSLAGKKSRTTTEERAKRFGDLARRVDVAGIKELSKSDPQAAYMAAQQMEQQLLQEQAAHQQQVAQQQQGQTEGADGPGKPEDEMKTEKGLELQAQLPFQKKQQLQNVQQLKMEIENELRARQTSTPKPGH